jgi:hypothetical protein
MKQVFGAMALVGLLAGASSVAAAPPRQAPAGEEYIVQAGDWLTKIADKYYGDAQEYTLILEATNTKAAEDNAFPTIDNADLIKVGQKLWVPLRQEEGIINVGNLSFRPIVVEDLGITTAVPAVWPAVEVADAFLKHTWRAGPFSFVSFATTPGNDAQIGVARLLGVNREDLTNEALGGQLSEREVGERSWTIYTRANEGTTSVVAATVQDKAIYQLSLFAVSPQVEPILDTILQNFTVTDPTAAQQILSISAPKAGSRLPNPFELRGTTSQYPFRGSLVYRVLDAEGNQVGRGPFEVVGTLGSPATFAIAARYKVAVDGPGTVEVAEVSATDGTIIAIDSVAVALIADAPGYPIIIDDPAPYASIKSPVQVRGKTGNQPFEGTLNYRIVDAQGQIISSGFTTTRGQLGETNSFDQFVEFKVFSNGPGRVEVFDLNEDDGSSLTIATVNVWLTTNQ